MLRTPIADACSALIESIRTNARLAALDARYENRGSEREEALILGAALFAGFRHSSLTSGSSMRGAETAVAVADSETRNQ